MDAAGVVIYRRMLVPRVSGSGYEFGLACGEYLKQRYVSSCARHGLGNWRLSRRSRYQALVEDDCQWPEGRSSESSKGDDLGQRRVFEDVRLFLDSPRKAIFIAALSSG